MLLASRSIILHLFREIAKLQHCALVWSVSDGEL